MKTKNTVLYSLIFISSGYLLYSYIFTENRYGMMRHHYGYYDDYLMNNFYLNTVFVFVSYAVIVTSILYLLLNSQRNNNNVLMILNSRLSKGEITVEEYEIIKSTIDANND